MPPFRSLCLLIAALLLLPLELAASPRQVFKIATLAPDGSIWTKRFRDFADEVQQKSNGELSFKLYMGGVMGDDRAMYRKMRIGQLQGGGFTMTGISEVVPDFRVMGIPLLFSSYAEVDRVRDGLLPFFQKAFAEKDLTLLAFTEVGFVYPMSASPLSSFSQLKATKCWAPENDPLSRGFLEDLGVSPIPLSIPDVLPALQTGMVNTVFNSFYGSIVLQWFSKTRYITETPFGYAYGGLIFAKKAYDRFSPQQAAIVEAAAKRHFSALLLDTRRSNEEALQTLKNSGIKMVQADRQELRQLQTVRDRTVKRLTGTVFSREILDATDRLLEAGKPKR